MVPREIWAPLWRVKKCRAPSINVIMVTCYSVAQSCLTFWGPMDCSMPGFPVFHHLSELAQTHVHWVSDTIQPSLPLSFPSPPAFNLSKMRVFSNGRLFTQVAKVLELHLQINPSSEYSGLISFRIDWFGLFAVQRTLKSLLHNNLKISILSPLFMVQLSHPYMTTGKTIALNIWTFVSKVMSLLLISCLVLS